MIGETQQNQTAGISNAEIFVLYLIFYSISVTID